MAKPSVLPSLQFLEKYLSYNPTTGIFTWMPRASNKTFNALHAGNEAGGLASANGYVVITLFGSNYQAHQLAWVFYHGDWAGSLIDHKNRIRNDNRISNLRKATTFENGQNRKDNVSGHVGVHWNKWCNKWQAQIACKDVPRHIGLFNSFDEAVKARQDAELKYFGCLSKSVRDDA